MTTVSEGMDVARIRNIATAMMGLAGRVDTAGDQGKAQAQTLRSVWSGQDADDFQSRWNAAMPKVHHAGQALREFGKELQQQAREQEDASGEGGGGFRLPNLPRCPFPSLPKIPGLFRRIATAVMDKLSAFFNHVAVKIPMMVKDLVDVITDHSDRAKQWLDSKVSRVKDAVKGWLSKVGDWGSKVGGWGKSLLKNPFVKFLGKKGIPGLGLGIAIYEARGTLNDMWNGEFNPRDIYNDIFLGIGGGIAGCVPGWGTVISLALGAEQIRFNKMEEWDAKGFEKFGSGYQGFRIARQVVTHGMWPLGISDFLPDTTYESPFTPKAVVENAWQETRRMAEERLPDIPFSNPTPLLPWGR